MSHENKVLPEIETMLANDGLYLLVHPTKGNQGVPIWVQNGVAYSMQLDSPLCPHGFSTRLKIQGPLTIEHAFATTPIDPSVN